MERDHSLCRRAVPGRHRRHDPRSPHVRSCAVDDRSGPAQWLAEAVATFTLILAILGGRRYAPAAVPWLVGLAITAAYWFTASTSFANPAVTLARGFTTTFAGIAINHVPGFVIAQFIGAGIGLAVSSALFPAATAAKARLHREAVGHD
jgi:glycerol uptake facilitator-like aquaporin